MSFIAVSNVELLDDYQLLVTFSNEESRIFDGSHLLSKPIFFPLRDLSLFQQAYADYGGIAWNDDLDLAAEYVYENSIPIN